MNFDLTEDQRLLQDSFARFLLEQSTMQRVRENWNTGFDADLWRGLAQLGALGLRVQDKDGGLGLGAFEATLLAFETGRTLASGPIAETIVALRLLSLASDQEGELLARAMDGAEIVTIAPQNLSVAPQQWVSGGSVASHILAFDRDKLLLLRNAPNQTPPRNMGGAPLASIALNELPSNVLCGGDNAQRLFQAALEELKLLRAAALNGLAREAVRLASAYASERAQFGQKIGAYQAISHPLAELISEIDGGQLFIGKAIHSVSRQQSVAGAHISLAAWWSMQIAGRAVAQALHTFGGYGLTTDYDIHLYNTRAKAWSLIAGDPHMLLEEAGRRLYANENASLPDVGDISVDYALGDDASTLAEEVDIFFKTHLTSALREKAHYSWDGHDPGIHRDLAEAGLLFPAWPTELGGRNASPYAAYAARKVWRSHGWTTHAVNTTGVVAIMIHRFGSDELKAEVLSKIVAGEAICSLGYSEPGSGSDVFAAQCRARPEGNGWRIDGAKMFTSGANIADYVLMLTRTDPEAAKHKGLTMFVVPLKSPGISVQPVFTFQEERTNITFYDGVKVPDSYRLGEVNRGVVTMSAGLELEHGGGFEDSQLALVEAAEAACAAIADHDGPLLAQPQAQARLARASAHAAIAELLSLRALWSASEKKPNLAFGPMAKLFSSEMFKRDAADLLDLTAPHSLIDEGGHTGFVNLCYRHGQAATIYGGTSEIHRSMIAERTLGLPRTRG